MVALHVVAAVLALIGGAVVLAMRKGTARHRRWGRGYSLMLTAMALSSFGVYELRDGPSVFHVISVLVLVVLAAGVAQPLRRRHRPGWMFWHLTLMQISYLMLVLTGVAQFFDRLPLPNDALNAIVFLQVPAVVGFVVILRSARRYQAAAS